MHKYAGKALIVHVLDAFLGLRGLIVQRTKLTEDAGACLFVCVLSVCCVCMYVCTTVHIYFVLCL